MTEYSGFILPAIDKATVIPDAATALKYDFNAAFDFLFNFISFPL
jgi:hypothetical protein